MNEPNSSRSCWPAIGRSLGSSSWTPTSASISSACTWRPSSSWMARILFSAPASSRMLLKLCFASASATPTSNFWLRSSAFLRRMATLVSYSGTPMSTINPPEKRVSRRSSSPSMSEGGQSLASTT